MYLRQLGECLRLGSTEQTNIDDLEILIHKFPSLFTLTDADGGPINPGENEEDISSEVSDSDDEVTTESESETSEDEDSDGSNDNSDDESGDDESEEADESEEGKIPYAEHKVTIRHTSIADYFNSGKQDLKATVRVDPSKVHLEIFKTCFRILADEDEFKFCDSHDGLVSYLFTLFEHLRRIDLSKTSKDDKLVVFKMIIALFNRPSVIERWFEAAACLRFSGGVLCNSGNVLDLEQAILENEVFFDSILSWCKDDDARDSCSNDPISTAWIDRTIASPVVELAGPFAMVCSRRWLQTPGNLDWGYEYTYEQDLNFCTHYFGMVTNEAKMFRKVQ
jgi:hypothetical protein